MTGREASNSALDEEMSADAKVFIMGEEVGEYQGVSKIIKYGPDRVRDTPISEVGFAGIGVHAAYHGLRPVVEFMTYNFSMQVINQIINSTQKSNCMSAGQIQVPIVFRGPNGATAGVSAQHSQCYAAWYASCPGLSELARYSSEDARGLLIAAIKDPVPLVFLENKLLYGYSFPFSSEALDSSFCLPIGKPKAAEILAKEGSSSEKFCPWGMFIVWPRYHPPLLVIVFFITAPAALFCICVARKLMDTFPGHRGTAIMVLYIIFTVFVLVLLLLTHFMDPGIVPRNSQPPGLENYENNVEFVSGQPSHLPPTKDVVVNGGATVKVKYCETCMLYRPPRCSHCRHCDNCVEKFDHHCYFIGNCIGLRNHRFFCMLVSSSTLLSLYTHVFCWVYIKKIKNREKCSIWRAMTKTPTSILLLAYTLVSFLVVGMFAAVDLYSIGTNQTTREFNKHGNRDNPYDKGIVQNFSEACCSQLPPSKRKIQVQRKSQIEDENSLASQKYATSSKEESTFFGGK